MTNITDIGQSVNLFDIFYSINEASNGWFVGLLLIAIWFLTLGLSKSTSNLDSAKAGLYASFVTTVIGLMFWAIEMISFGYVIIVIVMLIINIMMVLTESD